MPRQKSAPKRSGIDLEKLLLNKDDETTNFTPLPRRVGEGGEVKKINHEAVAKLFLRAVKNKEEEEEEEKNATKLSPTVMTNFNDDVLDDDDDDEKVEDRNTNNVLRLVKTLENSHEATRRALAEALGVVAGTQRERLETEEERRVILDENDDDDDDDDDEKEEDKAGEVFGRSTHGEGVEEDIAALPSTTFGSATYAEQLKQQVQRQQEKTEQHLLRVQKQMHEQQIQQQYMQRLRQQQQAYGALSTINDDIPYAAALARQQEIVHQQLQSQQAQFLLLQQQAQQQAMLSNPELMMANSTHPGARIYPFNAAAQKPQKGKRGRKKMPYIDPETGLEPVCAFSQDGTCTFAIGCAKRGKEVKYSKLNLRVPKVAGKYVGKLCCQTCYYRVKAANSMCAFVDEGCRFADNCKRKDVPVKYAKLSYRVPKNHDSHAGEPCCESCHYKIKTSGLKCAFTQDDTCVYYKNCLKRGVENIQFNKLKYLVPSTHPLFAGQRCCEPCHYHLKTKGVRCAFHKDGTCSQLKRKDLYDDETEPLAYKVLSYRVPETVPEFAGERCCDTCYRRCKAMGQMCAFAKEGTCTFAKSCERKNIPLVYKQLKYRVPKKNAKYPGELCCEACHYKCKALNERCVFFDTGECQHLVNAEKKGVEVNYTQLKYHVPKGNPQYAKYAGKTCCDACYVKIRSIGKECVFTKDGLCASIDGKLAFFTTLLTRRVPATHGRLAGALCCKSCFDKCKTGAKPGFRADEYPVPDGAEDETQMGKRTEPEKTGAPSNNGVEENTTTKTPPATTDSPSKKAKKDTKANEDDNNQQPQ
ncbi:unknown protein [Bathycoccus prasinos]|uniref:Uncharacterized protein n=1 Tax=Bathycoccus prasinos TaxID=41875 RepID=K8EV17_9CHLO|nr:unknown protein [Bathycoccus prasinos]CCO16315.1 unknown protein [Bathycoccus prasinos]|eukprot:XP_007513790.1 unknown protein [Bathycoccus prasinos]